MTTTEAVSLSASAAPARILVVDDTPANIQTLSAILKAAGYQISVAVNGKQALDAIEKVHPDLVLLDVMMPEMDGYETCERIKSSPTRKGLPIIFLTAKKDADDVVKGFELGAVDYVGKPFNAHELLARVRTHLTIDRLNRENTRLLLNVLPASIAERLKRSPGVIAERHEDASVLFADIVDFTLLSARMAAGDLLGLLNAVFSLFDELVDLHGLEKIKTIGDAYMVAGGLPRPQPDHLERMVRLACDMQAAVAREASRLGGVRLRIGVHAGSVVAGVIGTRRFSYDIWGDTVNTASRLESHGVPGRIQISEAVYRRLEGWCRCEPRGRIDLKGKGPTECYLVAATSEELPAGAP